MPPKGSKGRTPRVGSNEGNSGADPKITSPTTPKAGTSPEPDEEKQVNPDIDSDGSDLNEEDSFVILKKILLNQKIAEKKSDERFQKLSKSIKETKRALDSYKETNDKSLASIKTTVNVTVNDMKDLQNKVTGLSDSLDQATARLDATQKLLDETRKDLKTKAKIIDKLDTKYQKDEDELKRCLLLLDGISEQDKRPTEVVKSLLKDLGIEFKDSDIKAAYRLGPLKTGITRPRTIKVQFLSSKTKGDILKNIGKLKTFKKWKGLHINDALTPTEQKQAKDLRCIYAAGRAQGLDIKLRGNILIIDGVKLTYKDINTLPYGLSMETVKIISVPEGLAFQSHHAYLSNMYVTDIKYEGDIYITAEHLYTTEFVKHHDRLDLIPAIFNAEDGYAAKRVIRNIKMNETWKDAKYKIMRKIVALKFDQNDSIRDKLLGTKGLLFEATKDLEFGCGLTLGQAKDISSKDMKGENMLGILLCEYRDEIIG